MGKSELSARIETWENGDIMDLQTTYKSGGQR